MTCKFFLIANSACSNGAGGTFRCSSTMSNEQIAEAACKSLYGSCTAGHCGKFYYYYSSSSASCSNREASGDFEFIYSNTGYTTVGQDYGSGSESVSGNSLFVRRYHGSNSYPKWTLALANLGSGKAIEDC